MNSRSPESTTKRSGAPWLAGYPACVPAKLDYPDIPAYGLLERTAEKYPERNACVYYRQRQTYAELAEAARRTASALVKLGAQPGDRIGVLLPNVPEYLSALNGIWMAGCTAVAISPLMVPEEVSSLLEATDCRTVISLDLLLPLVSEGEFVPDRVLLSTLKDRLPHWQRLGYAFIRLRRLGFRRPEVPTTLALSDVLAEVDPSFQPLRPASLEDPAYILATGGTTGAPKAVVLSHRNLVANAWQLFHWAGAREARESMLAVLPLFHSYGLTTCGMTGVAMAAEIVMHHRFIPRVVLGMIEEHQPSIFPAVPAMLQALNELLRERPIRFENLRYCISGGAPLDARIADEFAEHSGATVVQGFGLSEASPVTHTGPLDGTARDGSIGLPLPDTDARIVDAEDGQRDLPPGEVGELLIRGPQVMLGYWKDPEATAAVIRDGWLHTGDLAVMDADGFFTIVDRKKDLIITSGFNVCPADVEPVLRGFPGVADAAVIGVPDFDKGELVKAVLAMEEGATLDEAAFDAYCRQHLSRHKRPRLVEISEGDLPRNFLGKVQRRQLREQHEAVQTPDAAPLAVAD